MSVLILRPSLRIKYNVFHVLMFTKNVTKNKNSIHNPLSDFENENILVFNVNVVFKINPRMHSYTSLHHHHNVQ